MSSLSGKTVIVTGAAEGIGAACTRALLERGSNVVMSALPGDWQHHVSRGAVAVPGDITEAQVRERIVAAGLDAFGGVDILINNAGVGLYAPPSAADLELSKRLFDVNVFAPLGLTQLVIPHLRARGRGAIVNIGSVGGFVSLPWAAIYCASKFSLHAINDALRRELAREGIHVMKVCPGIVDTKFREHVLGGRAPVNVESIRRVVSPDAVAAGVMNGLESRARSVYVPKIGKIFTSLEAVSSRFMDWYLRTKG